MIAAPNRSFADRAWVRQLHAGVVFARFLLVALLLIPVTVGAQESVSARYLGVSGDTVKLRMTIGSPAPQSLILEQYLPPGAKAVATSPSARQAGNSGVVKWLFKGVSPGNIDVTMRVSPAAAARSVSGAVRYRLPGGGGMQELAIRR